MKSNIYIVTGIYVEAKNPGKSLRWYYCNQTVTLCSELIMNLAAHTLQNKGFLPNQKLAVEYPHDIKIPLKQNVANINGTWEHCHM